MIQTHAYTHIHANMHVLMIMSIENSTYFSLFFPFLLYARSILNFTIITNIPLIIRIPCKNIRSLLIKTSERVKGHFANFLRFYHRGREKGSLILGFMVYCIVYIATLS